MLLGYLQLLFHVINIVLVRVLDARQVVADIFVDGWKRVCVCFRLDGRGSLERSDGVLLYRIAFFRRKEGGKLVLGRWFFIVCVFCVLDRIQ